MRLRYLLDFYDVKLVGGARNWSKVKCYPKAIRNCIWTEIAQLKDERQQFQVPQHSQAKDMNLLTIAPYFLFGDLSFEGSAARRGEVHSGAASANQRRYGSRSYYTPPNCVFHSDISV
jgi:hypothetical protein